MKIAVLVKQVPDTGEERALDPATGLLDRSGDNPLDEITERALETALRHKDADKGTQVVVISMGPDTVTKGLRKALSMGADSAVHIQDPSLAGADAPRTAAVLAAALRQVGADLVLAGNESTDGRGGVVPAMVAAHLQLPVLSAMDSVEAAGGQVTGTRESDGGRLRASAPLPAVVSVTERCAEARFPNFKGIMTAKRKPLAVLALADLGADVGAVAGPAPVAVAATKSPARTAGRRMVDDGSAGAELAAFLRAGHLV